MEKEHDLGLEIGTDLPDFSSIIDPERLLRLHPHWHILAVETGKEAVTASIKDHATGDTFTFHFELFFPRAPDWSTLMQVNTRNAALEQMTFFLKKGSVYVRTRFRDIKSPDLGMQAVELWIRGIRGYIRLYLKRTPNTLFFRWVMNRVMLQMNPSQRKICLMLFRFTLMEIFVIILIAVGYFMFGP